MPARTTGPNEIWLNGFKYPLAKDSRVRSYLSSQYAEKRVEGDFDADSDPRRSVVKWDDFRGGIGLYQIRDSRDLNRVWFASTDLQLARHISKAPLTTQANDTSPAASGPPLVYGELNVSGTRHIFGAFDGGTEIEEFGGTNWTNRATLADACTDSINVYIYDSSAATFTEFLVFAHYDAGGSGWSYSSDATTWATNSKDAKFLTWWDDRLWGIDHNGQLWFFPPKQDFTATAADCIDDAILPLPAGYANSMFVGRDAAGEEVIYVGTRVGLFVHDADNSRFVKTGLTFPEATSGGVGVDRGGDIFVTAGGLQIYQYSPASGAYTSMGLDRDDGLPGPGDPSATGGNDYAGDIEFLISTHKDLIAAVSTGANIRGIYAWSGTGWRLLDEFSTADLQAMYASNAHGSYRLWYNIGDRVNYIPLETNLNNPFQNTTRTYDSANNSVFLPWFDAGQSDINKLALRILVEATNTSADEDILITRSLNFSGQGSTLATIETDGTTSIDLPSAATPVGEAFRQFQIIATLRRGSTTTNSPILVSVALEYRKKLNPKWGATFELNLSERHDNVSPKGMVANLIAATESNPLVEFAYRDPNSDSEATYRVDVIDHGGLHQTGREYTGDRVRISVTEV